MECDKHSTKYIHIYNTSNFAIKKERKRKLYINVQYIHIHIRINVYIYRQRRWISSELKYVSGK